MTESLHASPDDDPGGTRYPIPPAELWGLWHIEKSYWLKPIDETGAPILAYLTRTAAEEGAQHEREFNGIASITARLYAAPLPQPHWANIEPAPKPETDTDRKGAADA